MSQRYVIISSRTSYVGEMGDGGWYTGNHRDILYNKPLVELELELTTCTLSAWPDNKEKCTELFDYCVTYTEEEPNPDKPFVTKVK